MWSILTYAAPTWAPIASQSQENLRRLQTIQNSALRIATGCHQRASSAHLHTETRILPIEDSLDLQCRQYLASALCPSHPSYAIVTQSSGLIIKKYPTVKILGVRETISQGQQSDPTNNQRSHKIISTPVQFRTRSQILPETMFFTN